MTDSKPSTQDFSAYTGSLVTLSEVLANIPPGELLLILERFESAVMENKIASLPEEGRSFTRDVIQRDGQRKKIRIADETLFYNEGVAAWITEQRRETRYLLLQHSDAKSRPPANAWHLVRMILNVSLRSGGNASKHNKKPTLSSAGARNRSNKWMNLTHTY